MAALTMDAGPERELLRDKSSEKNFTRRLIQLSVFPNLVPDFVSEYKDWLFSLKKPAHAKLRIAALANSDELYEWGNFYLPETVTMQVIGVLEGISCPCDELVLMVCEDKQVYAYDGEELHLVALNTEQLCTVGIEYPGIKTYYNGEAFKDMNNDDWEEVRKGPVGRRLDEEHKNLVATMKSSFLKNLKHNRQQKLQKV